MAKYSYETFADLKKANSQNNTRPKSPVGYFKLNDGEEAIVRFNYSSLSEFDIVTIHNVKVGDKFRKVSCLRVDGREPLDNCPLCAKGEPVNTRFFVKLIHYKKDETGKVVATPEVANFPKRYVDVISQLMNEYGDLRDHIFKITKSGSGLQTTYSILFANPSIYKEELGYVKDFSAFASDKFDLAHHDYLEKSKEDIEEYLRTGEFPYHKQAQTVETQSVPGSLQMPTDKEVDAMMGMQKTPEQVFDEQVSRELPPIPEVQPTQQVYQQPMYQQPVANTQQTDPTSRPRRTYEVK